MFKKGLILQQEFLQEILEGRTAYQSLLLGHSVGHVGYVDIVPGVKIKRSFNKEVVV